MVTWLKLSEEQVAFLDASKSSNDFLLSLHTQNQRNNGLSPNQIAALNKCIDRAKTPKVELKPGVYEVDGEVFVVKPNQSKTHMYAKRMVLIKGKRLNEEDDKVQIEFEYDQGAIQRIMPEHKMPFERAKALTIQYGKCIVCGRGLKDATSVEAGIGPVCRKYF